MIMELKMRSLSVRKTAAYQTEQHYRDEDDHGRHIHSRESWGECEWPKEDSSNQSKEYNRCDVKTIRTLSFDTISTHMSNLPK